jgi:chaperonin GroEL (HSP60 family)
MFITKNGYEMISQLEIEHPAGKVIQDICSQLNEDLNDGTINVIILIAELMRRFKFVLYAI